MRTKLDAVRAERNRNARRDKKMDKRKYGMRVSQSARVLASILSNMIYKRSQNEK